MAGDIEKHIDRVPEIIQLHSKIGKALRFTLEKAIRIGELLADQKAELGHGKWLPWIEENLPFSERTARDYMMFYGRQEELKSANVADLTDARRLLNAPRKGGKKPSKRRKKKKVSRVKGEVIHKIIELYKRLYRSVTGESAYIGAAQYAIVANLLKKQDEMEVTLRLERYFYGDYWFTKTNDYSLKGFISHYNEIVGLESADGNPSKSIENITSDEDLKEAEEGLHDLWIVLLDTPAFLDFLRSMFAVEDYKNNRYKDDDIKLDSVCEEESKREPPWTEDYALLQRIADGFSGLAEDCWFWNFMAGFRKMAKVLDMTPDELKEIPLYERLQMYEEKMAK